MNDTKRAVLTCAKNALAGWNVFGLFVRCVYKAEAGVY